MKVLIIGADGQLGSDLLKIFKSSQNEVAGLSRGDVDISRSADAESAIKKIKPQIVINCAAIVDTERNELFPEEAFLVNSLGAFYVAKAAQTIGATVVYISTDYVFDGLKKYFTEKDTPNPLNVYGSSKLAGEYLTKIANPKNYIIRTSALFGKGKGPKGNFVSRLLDKARSGMEIKMVNDQFTSPTYTVDLAKTIQKIIRKKLPYGVYHITNQGSASWYGFGKEIIKLMKINSKIVGIKTDMSSSGIKRPMYSVLINHNLNQKKISLPSWQNSLARYLKEEDLI